MNSLERAKHFLAQKASRLALAVVPLAAVAISSTPAKAAAMLTSFNCDVTTGSGSCGIELSDVSGGNIHLNSAYLSTSGSVILSSSGSLDLIRGSESGSVNGGTLTGTVPVSWDFALITKPVTPDPTVDWTITFTLYESGGGTVVFSRSGSKATSTGSGSVVSGTGNIPGPAGAKIVGYTIALDTNSVNGNDYEINIPVGSTLD